MNEPTKRDIQDAASWTSRHTPGASPGQVQELAKFLAAARRECVAPIGLKEEDEWIADYSKLTAFADVLNDLGAFETPKDVLYFFEKPAKWSTERARWVALGEPLNLESIDVLQDDEAFALANVNNVLEQIGESLSGSEVKRG